MKRRIGVNEAATVEHHLQSRQAVLWSSDPSNLTEIREASASNMLDAELTDEWEPPQVA
jgi:hypothetical protein